MSKYFDSQSQQVISKVRCPLIIQFVIRYKTDGFNNISKIFTSVSTGRVEENNIIIELFGRKYSLQSVVFHHGNSVNSRHYFTIKKQNNKWFCVNDSLVTENEQNINHVHISQKNHMLFYKLVNN